MKKYSFVLVGLILMFNFNIHAQVQSVDSDRTSDRNALRAMLLDGERLINEGKYTEVSKYFDPNINIIYQNAEVADGIKEIDLFIEKLFKTLGNDLLSFKTKINVDKPAEFYGNTAVAYGTIIDTYSFKGGKDLVVSSKWAATLVKEDNEWKAVSMQYTTNLFDNPVLDKTNASIKYFILGGVIAGLICGTVLGLRIRSRKLQKTKKLK